MAVTIENKTPAEYDLTHKMSKFMDRHLMFPILLEWDSDEKSDVFGKEDLLNAKIDLLKGTHMLDYLRQLMEQGGQSLPADLEAKRATVVDDLQSTLVEMTPLLAILDQEEVVAAELNSKSVTQFMKDHNLADDCWDKLFAYAIKHFMCGGYTLSASLLKHYRNIIQKDPEREDPKKTSAALWGSLACHILNAEWTLAAELAHKLDEHIDSKRQTKHEEVASRLWLLHWSLFIIFKCDKPGQFTKLVDMFLSDKHLQIILISAPWLIRYVSYIAIVTKRLRPQMKDIAAYIDTNNENFNDPMSNFLKCVYIDMDFEVAKQCLAQCQTICSVDYFLANCYPEFEENARLLIFETYCRIHQEIDINMIAKTLNMNTNEAEVWIVKLIQAARLDAKIDSEKNSVVMTKLNENVYHEVLEKTKNLSFRSMLLMTNLEKRNEKN